MEATLSLRSEIAAITSQQGGVEAEMNHSANPDLYPQTLDALRKARIGKQTELDYYQSQQGVFYGQQARVRSSARLPSTN